jgi:hypothetical protein
MAESSGAPGPSSCKISCLFCFVLKCINTAEKVKMILPNLSCYKLKATPKVKTTPPTGVKRCTDFSISNRFSRLLPSDSKATPHGEGKWDRHQLPVKLAG